MQQPGRTSTAALAVVPIGTVAAPEPPAELNDAQAEVWRTVVSSRPNDWFTPDTHKLLVSYCKHATTAAILDAQIDDFDPEWLKDDEGVERYKKLTDMREKQTRALTALARSMRLTHQATYRPEAKKTATRSKKLWEK